MQIFGTQVIALGQILEDGQNCFTLRGKPPTALVEFSLQGSSGVGGHVTFNKAQLLRMITNSPLICKKYILLRMIFIHLALS